jgi:hypothetical protein
LNWGAVLSLPELSTLQLGQTSKRTATSVWSAPLVEFPFVAIGFPSLPAAPFSTDSAALLSRWLGENKSTRDLGDRIFAAVRLALETTTSQSSGLREKNDERLSMSSSRTMTVPIKS